MSIDPAEAKEAQRVALLINECLDLNQVPVQDSVTGLCFILAAIMYESKLDDASRKFVLRLVPEFYEAIKNGNLKAKNERTNP